MEIFQIDAFTDSLFRGNPAAVCPLDNWLEDDTLLQIAKENNLAETAYYIPIGGNRFKLRWFTPEFEMDLCGHATLATAFVIMHEKGSNEDAIVFETRSGGLTVTRKGQNYTLNFPSRPPVKSELPQAIKEALNKQPVEVWKARDYVLLYNSEDDILSINPDMSLMNSVNIDPGGVIVTAPGKEDQVDFVSRFFTPQAVIFEDPVTGSAHCSLTPFWAERLGKKEMDAVQVSERRGIIHCALKGDRVELTGTAVKYMHGIISI